MTISPRAVPSSEFVVQHSWTPLFASSTAFVAFVRFDKFRCPEKRTSRLQDGGACGGHCACVTHWLVMFAPEDRYNRRVIGYTQRVAVPIFGVIGCAQRGEALRREAAEWCVMPSFKLFGFGFLCYLCVMRCVLFEILTGLPLILRPPDFFPVLCVCVYCVSATVHTPAWRGGCTVPDPFFPSPWGW